MPSKLLAVLVEDMDDLAFLMDRELTRHGWEIERYANLQPALTRIKAVPYPSLILLDLNLPDSSPPQTVRTIPEMTKYAPVLVISGRADPSLIRQIEEAGAMFQTKLTGQPESFLTKVVKALSLYKTRHLQNAEENLQLLREYLAHTDA